MDEQYYDIERRTAVKESARELRRKFLRYKDAEVAKEDLIVFWGVCEFWLSKCFLSIFSGRIIERFI